MRFFALVLLVGCGVAETSAEVGPIPDLAPLDATGAAHSRLLVADRVADRLLVVAPDGGATALALAADCRVDGPSSARRGPDGRLYVASFGNGRIVWVDDDGSCGPFFVDGGVVEEPVEILFHDERWYVLANDTRRMAVLSMEGELIDAFGYPAMRDAHDFAFGPDGALYVCTAPSGHADGQVQIWDGGELVGSFATPDEVELAASIAFDAEGRALVADFRSGKVTLFDPASGERLFSLAPRFDDPVALEISDDDVLHVADRRGVWRVTPTGAELVVAADAVLLHRPRGISFLDRGATAETAGR
jgi:sugar lactone lactonase YvrE